MQDEINEKTVALYIKTGKLTAEVLHKAMKAVLTQTKKQIGKQPHGKQTLVQPESTRTADELEAKARSGEQISLAEYAAALKAEKEQGKETKPGKKTEKKPSIRAQLKADKERAAQKKQVRSKSQDLERS